MYPPQSFGGYELLWLGAVEHLRRRGHEVRVLTTDVRSGSSRPDDPDVHRELHWYWRDHGFPRRKPWELLRIERHNQAVLDRHLVELRPEVVSWWSMGGMSLSLLESVRRAGIPAVAFVIDHWLEYGPHADRWSHSFGGRKGVAAPLAETLTRLPAKTDFALAARYVFASDAVQRKALDAMPGLEDIGIARCGIHPRFLDATPAGPWRWRLLYVGRLDERKGIHTAIDALALVPEARLTIVGGWDGREQARLAERARGAGLEERIVFAGQHEHDELPTFYAEADAVVFPVIWDEPWGLVPLEAMGCGCPVVATGRGGSGEYLRHGENCLLFEAEDHESLAAALRRLADEPELRERIREGGLATAPRYTEERFNQAVEDELERVARRRRGRELPDPQPLA